MSCFKGLGLEGNEEVDQVKHFLPGVAGLRSYSSSNGNIQMQYGAVCSLLLCSVLTRTRKKYFLLRKKKVSFSHEERIKTLMKEGALQNLRSENPLGISVIFSFYSANKGH